jgi:hypothetical protein
MTDYLSRRQAQTSSRLHGNNFFTFSLLAVSRLPSRLPGYTFFTFFF